MAYDRRQQRRQGVVYGPPRSTGRFSDTGALIGRFLGLGILVLALGVLAAGALAFVGARPGETGTPARSALVVASVSFLPATLGASLAVTQLPATFAPSFGLTGASLPPPATPSAAPPLIQVGAGYVTFGTDSDEHLHIVDPRSTSRSRNGSCGARTDAAANSADLHEQIVKLDGAGGRRAVVLTRPYAARAHAQSSGGACVPKSSRWRGYVTSAS